MKCRNCNSELQFVDGHFYCRYCDSTYLKEELLPINQKVVNNSNFITNNGVLVKYTGLDSNVTIPECISVIGPNAFKDNIAIQYILFSSSVHTVEDSAFENCVNLSKIDNYQNIKSYGKDCFRNTGLSELDIGPNVIFLGETCFSSMNNLIKVNYHPGKIIKHRGTFTRCSKLTQVNTDDNYFFIYFNIIGTNNKNNPLHKPTIYDAFVGTPYYANVYKESMDKYKKGICPHCGGKIKKGLFSAICLSCGIDLKS